MDEPDIERGIFVAGQKFEVVQLKANVTEQQMQQFVGMMQKMYDFHATLHQDWQSRSGWQKGSSGWIKRASTNDEAFFAIAYPLNADSKPQLDKPAGYVTGSFHQEAPLFIQNRFGYIADLWVEPDYRRHQIGQQLLDAAFDWFKTQNIDRVQLEVDVNNAGGLNFWRKMGFEDFEIVMRRNI